MERRNFLGLGLAGGTGLMLPTLATNSAAAKPSQENQNLVSFIGDGPEYSPEAYGEIVFQIAKDRGINPDYYSLGGAVTELEEKMAAKLGKEKAVFFPTGTMANHLALRVLARSFEGNRQRRKVIVPHRSHVFNDTGDACQEISGLNLIPLSPNSATFTVDDILKEINRASAGKVKTEIGTIMIESPVRRLNGELFDFEEMKKVTQFAKDQDIRMHLDGARLFMGAAYLQKDVSEIAGLFDTVYVSLWKYFGAPTGAILAGPAELIDELHHQRRMFGGSLTYAWVSAAVALHFMDGFEERFSAGVSVSNEVLNLLKDHPQFEVRRIENGTNIFFLKVIDTDLESFRNKLTDSGITIRKASSAGEFKIQVNESWRHMEAKTIFEILTNSL